MAMWGWMTATGAQTGKVVRYTSYEDENKTLLVYAVEKTTDRSDTGIRHDDRALVTTTEQGTKCSGRLGRFRKIN